MKLIVESRDNIIMQITKHDLDEAQAAFDAGNRETNKFIFYFNDDLIIDLGEIHIFYDWTETAAAAFEVSAQPILSRMYAASSFSEKMAIFEEEFGSRITLLPGAQHYVIPSS